MQQSKSIKHRLLDILVDSGCIESYTLKDIIFNELDDNKNNTQELEIEFRNRQLLKISINVEYGETSSGFLPDNNFIFE